MQLNLGLKSQATLPGVQVGVNIDENCLSLACVNMGQTSLVAKQVTLTKEFNNASASQHQAQLEDWVKDFKLQGLPCHYTLNNGQYTCHLSAMPNVSEDELGQALKWANQDLIAYDIETAKIQCLPIAWPRASDNARMAYSVIVKQETIDAAVELIAGTGLRLKSIDIPELALRNLILQELKQAEIKLYVYLGAKQTKLILCQAGQIFLIRQMEFDCLALKSKINEEHQNYLLELIERLSLEIQRSFDYCSSVYRQNITQQVAFFKTEFFSQELQELLKKQIGIPIESLELNLVDPSGQAFDLKNMAFAVGAALRNEVQGEDAIH